MASFSLSAAPDSSRRCSRLPAPTQPAEPPLQLEDEMHFDAFSFDGTTGTDQIFDDAVDRFRHHRIILDGPDW